MGNNTPAVGQFAPDFKIVTSKGEPFSLNKELNVGFNVMFLLYRGHW